MSKLVTDKSLAAREAAKRHYRKNTESEKARSTKWREENRERSRAIQRKSYYKNKEKRLLGSKRWQKNNLVFFALYDSKRRARIKNNGVYKISKKDMKRLKNKCCVSCNSFDQIQIDHIIPISRGGQHSIGNLQPLCKSCNLSKGSKFMLEWKKLRENN